jgi:enediyne biosynthesis protein E4
MRCVDAMKMKTLYLALFLSLSTSLFAQGGSPQIVKRDNGTYGGNSATKLGQDIENWEESVLLQPKGPCEVDELHVYVDGESAGQLEIWIMADPSEGSIPPTGWVRNYASLTTPITVNYDGIPGWDTIDLRGRGLRSDGYDRLCIQHTSGAGGPYFGLDKSTATGSFLMNPDEPLFPQYAIPGKYYLANGNFMVRLVVRYDYPNGTGSASAPSATFGDKAKIAKLWGDDNKALKSARVSVADWDQDGWDDVVIGGKFFRNNHDSTFTNVTTTIGIDSAGGGYVFGDINNDGYTDCYSVNGGTGDKIFAGSATGIFTDITSSTGITNPNPTITPMWFDYDRDGWLDLFIANGRTADAQGNETYYPDQLWHNKGNAVFENVTTASGIADAEPDPYYDCWAATIGDYNVDGYPDIFVADYRLQPDMLLKNNRNGTFTDVAEETGAIGVPTVDENSFGHGAGCEFADYNNDGLPDLFVGNLGHPDWRGQYSNPSLLFINDMGFTQGFVEKHKEMGIKFFEMNFGVVSFDADLDGNQDLFHCQYAYNATSAGESYRRSRMYYNQGATKNWHMNDMTWLLGCNIHGAWTAARGDFDNDGDMDIVAASPTDAVKYFRNDVERHGKYLSMRLKGKSSEQVNTDAYGSSVTVYSGNNKWYRDLMSGGSGTTATQNSNMLHFGLGYISTIDSVVIHWPNGTSFTTTELQPNKGYTVTYPNIIEKVFESIRTASNSASIHVKEENGNIVLEYAGGSPTAEVIMHDVLGKTILMKKLDLADRGSHILRSTSGLHSGLYIVNIRTSNGLVSEKILITK